jgi:hypothetical protein
MNAIGIYRLTVGMDVTDNPFLIRPSRTPGGKVSRIREQIENEKN